MTISTVRRAIFGVLLLTLPLVTGGCGANGDLPERLRELWNKDSLTILKVGVMEENRRLHPLEPQDSSLSFLLRLIHAGPLRRTPEGFEPQLWETWTASSTPDGRLLVEGTWKQGLTWHDGVPFSTKDLRFTIDALKDHNLISPLSLLAEKVVSLEELDGGRRIRIIFTTNSRQNLHLLTAGLLPSHLLAAQGPAKAQIDLVLDGTGTAPIIGFRPPVGTGTPDTRVSFAEFPVGLGPFRLVGRKVWRFLELAPGPVATPSASADSPPGNGASLTRIIVRMYGAPEDLLTDLRRGLLDVSILPSDYAQRIFDMKVPGLRAASSPNPSHLALVFNTRKAPFDMPEVRKAIDLAVDRQKIRSSFPLTGRVLAGPPLGSESEFLAPASCPPNPGKARELLLQAGFTDSDNNGKLEWQGKPLQPVLLTNGDNVARKLLADQIAENLRSAGLDARSEVVDWSELVGKHLEPGEFDFCLMGFQAGEDGSWINLWHSSPPIGDRLNYTGFTDPALDAALMSLDRFPPMGNPEADRATVVRILREKAPALFLFQPMNMFLYSERIRGISMGINPWEVDLGTLEKYPSTVPAPAAQKN